METAIEPREGNDAPLAVLKPQIFENDCAIEVEFRCSRQRNPMLCLVRFVLGCIELDFHVLL
jgi:hypothetical protein